MRWDPNVRPTNRRVFSYMRFTKEFKLECIRKYKTGEHIYDPGGCKHKTFIDTNFKDYLSNKIGG